jgi:hypothetical protein
MVQLSFSLIILTCIFQIFAFSLACQYILFTPTELTCEYSGCLSVLGLLTVHIFQVCPYSLVCECVSRLLTGLVRLLEMPHREASNKNVCGTLA